MGKVKLCVKRLNLWQFMEFKENRVYKTTKKSDKNNSGNSSVVERHVANVNVGGSNPLTRFLM